MSRFGFCPIEKTKAPFGALMFLLSNMWRQNAERFGISKILSRAKGYKNIVHSACWPQYFLARARQSLRFLFLWTLTEKHRTL